MKTRESVHLPSGELEIAVGNGGHPYREPWGGYEFTKRVATVEEERAHAFALVWVTDFPETTYTDAFCFELAAGEGRSLPWPRRET